VYTGRGGGLSKKGVKQTGVKQGIRVYISPFPRGTLRQLHSRRILTKIKTCKNARWVTVPQPHTTFTTMIKTLQRIHQMNVITYTQRFQQLYLLQRQKTFILQLYVMQRQKTFIQQL
jgi:hypothetical protein